MSMYDKRPLSVAVTVYACQPGDVAMLRRMTAERRCPAFWRIRAAHLDEIISVEREARWALFMRTVALMAPTVSSPSDRGSPHDPSMRVGKVLYEEGVNEARIRRLGIMPGPQRRDSLVRILRGLKVSQLNMNELGRLLVGDKQRAWEQLAEAYYGAEHQASSQSA